MNRIRRISMLLTTFMLITGSAYAVKYEQDLTLGNWVSRERVEEQVKNFCSSAEDDPNLKVVGIKYRQQPDRDMTYYSATITCYVSEVDKDLKRVQDKAEKARRSGAYRITGDADLIGH